MAHVDDRGVLLRCFPFPVHGEVYAVRVEAGKIRGLHYHRATDEWFVGADGPLALVIVRVEDGFLRCLPLEGLRVRVPRGWAHAIVAPPWQSSLVLAAMDLPHDPADVVPFPVEVPCLSW